MDERFNELWIGGVQIDAVASGDVSAYEDKVEELMQNGGGWLYIPTGIGIHYRVYLGPSTSVVFRYANY